MTVVVELEISIFRGFAQAELGGPFPFSFCHSNPAASQMITQGSILAKLPVHCYGRIKVTSPLGPQSFSFSFIMPATTSFAFCIFRKMYAYSFNEIDIEELEEKKSSHDEQKQHYFQAEIKLFAFFLKFQTSHASQKVWDFHLV